MRLHSAKNLLISAAVVAGFALSACGGDTSTESIDTINSEVETSLDQLNVAVKSARASSSSTMLELRAAAESAVATISDAVEKVDDLEGDGADGAEAVSYRKGLVAERELAESLAAARPSPSQIQLSAAKAKLALNSATGEQLTAIDVSALVHSIKKSRSNSSSSSRNERTSNGSVDSATTEGGDARTFYAGQGNVSCRVSESSAICSVASSGVTFAVEGSSSGRRESGLRIAKGSGSFAPYGSSVTVGKFSCSIPPQSQASGITCRNTSTGHGFEASRSASRQKTF